MASLFLFLNQTHQCPWAPPQLEWRPPIMVPGVDMRRGVQRCPGWDVESPETGGEVQGATGQERPQLSDEGSTINTGTHLEEKVLAKHANMQVNMACYNLDYIVRLGLQCLLLAHVLTVPCSLCLCSCRGHSTVQQAIVPHSTGSERCSQLLQFDFVPGLWGPPARGGRIRRP